MAISINGLTGISGVDGTAAAPSYKGSDANTGVSFGTDTVTINTGGTARVTTDASGNVGVGVTPSAWNLSGLNAFQVKNAGFAGYLNSSYVTANAYFSGSNWYYVSNGNAGQYIQSAGRNEWYTAPSGTAGAVISFTQAMTLSAAGELTIGANSNLASSKLDVRGRVRVGSGNSSGDAEVIWSNYASATNAWTISVRQDVGGANNDLKFLRFDSSGAYQGVSAQFNSAGTFEQSVANGVPQLSNLNTGTYANGASVGFANMSGFFIVNNHGSGAVGVWIAGAGGTTLISSIGTTYGSMAYDSNIAGYRWTSNDAVTRPYTLTAIRTRNTA